MTGKTDNSVSAYHEIPVKTTNFDIALFRELMSSLRMFRWSGIQITLCLPSE